MPDWVVQGLLCWPSVQPLMPVIGWCINRIDIIDQVFCGDVLRVISGHDQVKGGSEAPGRQILGNPAKIRVIIVFQHANDHFNSFTVRDKKDFPQELSTTRRIRAIGKTVGSHQPPR